MKLLRRMRHQPHWVTWRRAAVAATALAVVTLVVAITRLPGTPTTTGMFRTRRSISAIIVEEHHEVLPYWIQAANEGILPKSGNTLVHIDGHSDEALPQLFDGVPFFEWPSTDEKVQALMQKNDVFIMGAVMSGLIDRIIFIYPSWDSSVDSIYETKTVGLGWMNLAIDGSLMKHLCICTLPVVGGTAQCLYEDPYPKANQQEVELKDPSKCNVMRRYTVEHIVEYLALNKLQGNSGWLGRPASIILDIDEDYFGCELGAEVLLNAGVSWTSVLNLSRKVAAFFCPKTIEHESLCNHVMRAVMKAMIDSHSRNGRDDALDDMCSLASVEMRSIWENIIKRFSRDEPNVLCSNDENRMKENWESVMVGLCMFNRRDFEAVMDLGFCLSTSPSSVGFGTPGVGLLEVCHGANTPNDTLVFLHTPEDKEIDGRMTHLGQILSIIDSRNTPRFVTMCRSVRDGYTPRKQFDIIESGIINIFQQLPTTYSVFYDQNLLGGQGGWSNRHSIIKPTKLNFNLPKYSSNET